MSQRGASRRPLAECYGLQFFAGTIRSAKCRTISRISTNSSFGISRRATRSLRIPMTSLTKTIAFRSHRDPNLSFVGGMTRSHHQPKTFHPLDHRCNGVGFQIENLRNLTDVAGILFPQCEQNQVLGECNPDRLQDNSIKPRDPVGARIHRKAKLLIKIETVGQDGLAVGRQGFDVRNRIVPVAWFDSSSDF